MDENFNSLVEEQKEPCISGSEPNNTNASSISVRCENGIIGDSLTDISHPSLEKLAELTAAMSRFELDMIAAATQPRARSKSDPTPTIRSPTTMFVKSCDEVGEHIRDVSATTNEFLTSSEKSSPTNETFETKGVAAGPASLKPHISSRSKAYQENRRIFYRHPEESYGPTKSFGSDSRLCAGYIWNGELPPRNYSNPTFSSKIFVGGVPWDISEAALTEAFSPYGACRVEWPSKEIRSHPHLRSRGKVTGYVYIIFETERSVKSLLQNCSQQFGSAGEWYFKIRARRSNICELRQVQIIPWVISDSSYMDDASCRLDPKKTVFVGALHGMITAHVLFSIMNELYGNVVFVGIDTDKHKYPIGSGRVTFRTHTSYFKAIESAFLEIRTSKFCKKVQIDPFLEDSLCMVCGDCPGPFFCRDRTCFRYYCGSCWQARHGVGGNIAEHRPLTRHASRSAISCIGDHSFRSGSSNSSARCYLPCLGNAPVTPLGGVAAVAAVARGTVPRQQRHAYQYMQLTPAYPAAVYTPTVIPHQCRINSNVSSSPLVTHTNGNLPSNTSSSYVHQRLY